MNKKNDLHEFNEEGIIIIKNVLSEENIYALKNELIVAIKKDFNRYGNVIDKGMIHNCMFKGQNMKGLLDHPIINNYLEKLFSPTCILYAYQSSSLFPHSGNYGTRIHVDCPRFIPNYTTNVGIILPLDEFSEENGATLYLPKSHKNPEPPTDDYFFNNAKTGACNQGDMIIFNGRLYHSAGINKTNFPRHALTMNFCRSFMKQRFDYTRMINDDYLQGLGENGKRLIGWNSRPPISQEDFYLPEPLRTYRAGQE